jgi:hypothetical protein
MQTNETTLTISFPDAALSDAGQKAAALRDSLLDASPDIRVDLRKSDPSTQDFGATLVLVIGTPAILAIANGIADYMRRRPGTLRIERDGVVSFEGTSADAARIAEAVSRAKP